VIGARRPTCADATLKPVPSGQRIGLIGHLPAAVTVRRRTRTLVGCRLTAKRRLVGQIKHRGFGDRIVVTTGLPGASGPSCRLESAHRAQASPAPEPTTMTHRGYGRLVFCIPHRIKTHLCLRITGIEWDCRPTLCHPIIMRTFTGCFCAIPA